MTKTKKLPSKKKRLGYLVIGVLLLVSVGTAGPPAAVQGIVSQQTQAGVWNRCLKWRLDNLLPELMDRTAIDMWVVINREYNEDPVYLTLVPRPCMNARRTSILVFYRNREENRLDRFSGSYYPFESWYQGIWLDKKKDQFHSLARFIREKNPRRIGINRSDHWAFGDGLSCSLHQRLIRALGKEFSSRLVSAEALCVGWLETRSPLEMEIYPHVASVAHALIREFFSSRVIKPGITTRHQVRWWIRERINQLGLDTWFFPSIDIVRKKSVDNQESRNDIIRRGDLLHCDVGIVYLGLCTDMQWNAYVCESGEQDAPPGLRAAHEKALRVAEIFMGEFKNNRSGREIVDKTMEKVERLGIETLIYSHPVGFHGHAAGPPMEGRPPGQKPADARFTETYPLYRNTAYAIEFSVFHRVPEWDNQKIRLGFEENALFTEKGCRFIDGCQEALILIK